jgi:hypothetical protein
MGDLNYDFICSGDSGIGKWQSVGWFQAPAGVTPPDWLEPLRGQIGAVVVDYYGTVVAKQIRDWLQWAGFKIGCGTEIDKKQFAHTCGFIAARIAADQGEEMHSAPQLGRDARQFGGWMALSHLNAVAESVWRDGFAVLGTPDADPWDFIDNEDIDNLMEAWDNPTEPLSAPLCPSLDQLARLVANDLRALSARLGVIEKTAVSRNKIAAFDSDDVNYWPRRLITNASTTSSGGTHWFNVTYAWSDNAEASQDDCTPTP